MERKTQEVTNTAGLTEYVKSTAPKIAENVKHTDTYVDENDIYFAVQDWLHDHPEWKSETGNIWNSGEVKKVLHAEVVMVFRGRGINAGC